MKEYRIIRILHNKELKKNYYSLILLTVCNKKLFGCNNFIPMINDIIKCNITKTPDGDSNKYDFSKSQEKPIFLLPDNKNEQIVRLLHFRVPLTDNNTLYKLNYGKNFWIEFYNYYLELSNIDNYLNNSQTNLTNLFNHIKNYINTFITPFKKILLEKYDIKGLNQSQLIILYTHPKFGLNVNSWNIDGLLELYDIKGFGDKTITLRDIAKKLKFKIEDMSKIIIINIFKNNDNTYMKYNYDDWLDQFANYEDEINISNLSIDMFNDIIDSFVRDKIIIKINENILSLAKLFIKELSIAKNLIDIQFSESKKSLLDILNQKYFVCSYDDITKFVKDIEVKKYNLDPEQQLGIINIFKNNISVIHGKAGTGKTNLLTGFFKCIEEFQLDISLSFYCLAPTASAKAKMENTISECCELKINYSTMHGFNMRLDNNIENIQNKLLKTYNITLRVIDETSMSDSKSELLNKFLNLINDPTMEYKFCIIFLGDYRQLPSIGAGNILRNIISSTKIPHTKLLIPHRYYKTKNLWATPTRILIMKNL